MKRVLEGIKSDKFAATLAFSSTIEALYWQLSHSPETNAVIESLKSHSLDETDLERFIRDCFADYKVGELFPHDRALAALAVALKIHPGDFADSFLKELAGINSSDIPFAPKIAQLVMQMRSHLAVNKLIFWNFPLHEELPARNSRIISRATNVEQQASWYSGPRATHHVVATSWKKGSYFQCHA